MRLLLTGRASLLCAVLAVVSARTLAGAAAPERSAWRLSWSDEFNGPDGTAPDPAKWTIETGGKGHGNHELEGYTARPENVHLAGGSLVLTARKEDLTASDGVAVHYTSARLNTQDHFTQRYGRFEARMKLPLGKGLWPAFWMLGEDIASAGWPKCGEIDIMENIGEAAKIYSTLHGPGYSGGHAISANLSLPSGDAVNAGYHLYAAEWEPGRIRFYLDDALVVERTPADLPAGAAWVYDHPFFVLLNLAVGGDWPGYPDASTAFPQQMLVDYVRIYQRTGEDAAGRRLP